MKFLRSQEYCNKLVCTSQHLFSEAKVQIISYCTSPNIQTLHVQAHQNTNTNLVPYKR